MNKKNKNLIIIVVLLFYVIGSYFYNDYTMPNDINRISLPDLEPKDFNLTSEDYVEDFLYAYEVLKDNYPYFEINKQVHGVDWLANKNSYVDYISKSSDDLDFLNRMDKILGDTNNFHTNVMPEDFMVALYVDFYEMPKNNWRHELVEVFEKENVRRRYNINNENIKAYIEKYFSDNSTNLNPQKNNNLKIRSIIDNELAYIGIKSFIGTNLKSDQAILDQELIKYKDYSNLIIDIRSNGGGTTNYWQRILLPKLIESPQHVNNYLFIKDGPVNRLLIDNGVIDSPGVSKFLQTLSFDQKTKDILNDFDFYCSDTLPVYPADDSINYQGKIYLLVDGRVYSSAEALANFCKESGLATLVGTRTLGDGLGFDPLIFDLPNTGYAIRYPASMGVTESGSINERDQTTPDIEVENAGQEVDLPFREQKTIRAVMEDAGLEFKN